METHAQTSRETNTTPDSETPSHLLNGLMSLHEPEVFHSILVDKVWPVLDSLHPQERRSLVAALSNQEDELTSPGPAVEFDEHQAAFTKEIKDLKRMIRNDPDDFLEFEIMNKILKQVTDWIPALWEVGVGKAKEHALVHRSLKLCKATLDTLYEVDSSADFCDVDTSAIIRIVSADGNVVYEQKHDQVEHAIFWVWRELLISAALQTNGDKLVRSLAADIEKSGYAAEILKRLQEEKPEIASERSESPEPGVIVVPMGPDLYAYGRRELHMNDHWTPEMTLTLPGIRALLADGQLRKFTANPSHDTFLSLMTADAGLKDRLLDITRSRFLAPNAHRSLHPAFEIFQSAEADNDLLWVLDAAKSAGDSEKYGAARVKAVTYLSSRSDEVRSKAMEILRPTLLDLQDRIVLELEEAFPTLSVAWAYLDKHVESGRLELHTEGEPNAVRAHILKEFLKKAGWKTIDHSSDDSDYDSDYDGFSDGDSDDSGRYYSRAERVDLPIHVIKDLMKWVQVLNKWPVASERDAMKQAARDQYKEGHALYEVDGVAEALASQCDWPSEPCRQKLGRAIRDLYWSFAVDGPEKGRIKEKLLDVLSFRVVY